MEEKIMGVLLQHQGKGNAITVAEIVERIGGEQQGLTNPSARKAIKELITKEIPIGSCSTGYFVIQTDKEFKEYYRNLNSRKHGISSRMESLIRAWEHHKKGD